MIYEYLRLLGTNVAVVRPKLEKLGASSDEDIRADGWLLLQGLSTNAPRRWVTPSMLAGIELE